MSKLVDKLLELTKSSSTPIGFGHSISEQKGSAMLLVARVPGRKLDEVKIVADASVSAALICGEGPSTKVAGQMAKALGDIPLGVFVSGMNEEEVHELAGVGCDFVVFDISMPTSILQEEGVGKILMIEPSLEQGFVKAINSVDVDGVFITSGNEHTSIDVEHLLVCRRFVEIIERPVIIDLPSSVTTAELTVLRQTGIVGLVASSQQSVETLRELGKTINELPEKTKSRRARTNVRLPHYGGSVSGDEDEEQDEI